MLVLRHAFAYGHDEIVPAAAAYPGIKVRRDVGRINHPLRRDKRQPSGEWLSFWRGMTGNAISGTRKIGALLHGFL